MFHRPNPAIDELLEDRLIQAVMRADRVDPHALRTLLDGAASRIAARRESEPAMRFLAKPPIGRRPTPRDESASRRVGATPMADPCGSAVCC